MDFIRRLIDGYKLIHRLETSHSELVRYLPETMLLLADQLESDDVRWGDEWKQRPVWGQEERIVGRINQYYEVFLSLENFSFPWLKVLGLAHIALVRSLHAQEIHIRNLRVTK